MDNNNFRKKTAMSRPEPQDKQIGLFGAAAIGVGGMVGGGIFAVLGLASVLAGGATPIAFLVAGCVTMLTAYSYAKLSVTYPNNGGTIIFIDKAFGVSWFTGAANMLLWIGYIVTLSLYAVAFGNYAQTFLPQHLQTVLISHVLISTGILLPTILNLLSAAIVSKTEIYIVALKIAILVVVVALGFSSVVPARIEPKSWPSLLSIVEAGMLIFVAFEGFELIANTSASVKNYKQTLPRAYYASVLFVLLLYVLIAVIVVGSLSTDQIAAAQDFALAKAAEPSLGRFGFTLVGVTAVLATLSAINSTLYGSARLSYSIATEGELPKDFELKIWNQPIGLLITSGAALLLSNMVDLSSISMMASGIFLIVFALVNLANTLQCKETGSSRLLALFGVLMCLAAFFALMAHVIQNNPLQLWILFSLIALAGLLEGGYIIFLKNDDAGKRISGV